MGKAAKGTRKLAKKGLAKPSHTAPKNKTNKLIDKEKQRAEKQKVKRQEKREQIASEKANMTPEDKRKRGFEIQERIKERRRQARKKFEALPAHQQKKFLQDRRLRKKRTNYDLEKEVGKEYAQLINIHKEGWEPELFIDTILELIKDSTVTMAQFAQCKVGSRALQACLKYGNGTQRLEIAKVVEANFSAMLWGKCSHMVLLKTFRYIAKHDKGTDSVREKKFSNMVALFTGKLLNKSFFRKFECNVVNTIYHMEKISRVEKRKMLHELIVPAVVALQTKDFRMDLTTTEILALPMEERMKKTLVEHLQDCCNKAIDKELLQFGMVHEIFDIFTSVASEDQLTDLMDRVVMGVPHLLASKQGASAFNRLLGVASGKHRRGICKALKGQWVALSKNDVDAVVVLRLLKTVDDTVMLNKSIFGELKDELLDICTDEMGRKIILSVLAASNKRYLSPEEFKMLSMPAPTSLKEPEDRRKQLMDPLLVQLKPVILSNISTFISDKHAKDVLVEYLCNTADEEVCKALCDALSAALDKGDDLLDKPFLAGLLNRLIRDEKATKAFVPMLFEVLKNYLEVVISSRLSFVLLDLLKQESVSAELVKLVQENEADLVEATEGPGGKKFLEEVDKKLGTSMAEKVVIAKDEEKKDSDDEDEEDEEKESEEKPEQTEDAMEVDQAAAEESESSDEEDSDEEMEFIDGSDSGSD